MDAFVYLRVQPGKAENVVIQLQAIRGVRHAVAVIGDWDIMAAVHGPDLQSIAETVVRQIHRIEGIERTSTAPVVPGDVLGLLVGGLGTPPPMQHPGDACYVHVKAAPGAAAGLIEAVHDIEGISAVALLAGEFDALIEVPMPWEQASRIILEEIQGLPGVLSTRTLVSLPYIEPEEEERDQFSAWT